MKRFRILFEPFLIYHLPQFLPFYELIRDDQRFEIRFAPSGHTEAERSSAQRIMLHEHFPLIEAASEEERIRKIEEFDPDILIIGWGRKGFLTRCRDRSRPLIIMIYHGIGVKASYFKDNDPRIDLRAVESPYRIQQLKKHGASAGLLLTGCIKLDPLYTLRATPSPDLPAKLGLSTEKKTILYAPTFYPSSIEVLKNHLAEATRGYNLVIKPHNYTRHHPDYRAQLALLHILAERYDHIAMAPPEWYNILPLFSASDLLLTDASSVMYEYLALDRPIIVCRKYALKLRHRLFSRAFKKSRIDNETLAYDRCYESLFDPRKLKKTIEHCMGDPARLGPQRREVHKELLYFDDGGSSLRLLQQMEELLPGLSV